MTAPVLGRAQIEIVPQFGPRFAQGINSAFRANLPRYSEHGKQAGTEVAKGAERGLADQATRFKSAGDSSAGHFFGGFTSRVRAGPFRAIAGIVASGLLAAGAAGAIAGATMGVKTAASLEQSTVAFTSLLHSGQKAQVFLGDLQHFAATTPFTLPGLVDASRQLIGVGEASNKVIPTLTAWGDTAGALGISQDAFSHSMLALTQAMGNGKLQAGDLLQITQAGIPIWSILAKSLGKPVSEVRKLSEQGKLLTADVLPKLEKQMEKDYGGSMAKQSMTLTGLWSTFTDTLNLGLASSIQPLIPALKTGMVGAINAVGGALRLIPAAGHLVAPVFHALVTDVRLVIGAFRDPDVTSSGFHGFLERVGSDARHVVDVIIAVTPKIIDLGRVFIQHAVPAIAAAWTWVSRLIPPLISAGRAVVVGVMPGFRSLAQFVTGSVVPTLRNLWSLWLAIAPSVRVVAAIVGITVIGAFRAVASLLNNVVGPAVTAVTGFFVRNHGALLALSIAIGVLLIPKLVQLGVTALVSAGKQVAAWTMSAAGSAAALVKYEAFSVFAVRYYATVAAQAVWSAARQVGAWVATGAAASASAIRAVGAFVLQGARWVWLGTMSLVQAARVAAAWVISLGPVAWVTATVIGVTALIILNWNKIWSGTKRIWSSVSGAVGGAVDWIRDKVVGVANSVARTWQTVWSGVASATSRIWNGLKEIFAAPVRFVVNVVLAGVVRAADWLLDKIHLHIPIPSVNFQTGGRIPGYGGGDTVPAMLERGEAVIPKHLVGEISPWARDRGIPGFQGGGIVGWVGRQASRAGHAVASAAEHAFNAGAWVVDEAKGLVRAGAANALQATLSPFVNMLAGMAGKFGLMGQGVGALGQQALSSVIQLVRGHETTVPAISAVAGAVAGAWRGVFLQALGLAGQPASWVDLGLRRLNQESGGNKLAVNRWDDNWRRGTPSVGLMQVIGPTFASYAGRFRGVGPFMYGVSVDPLANIFAAIMYTLSRYGTLAAWGRPGGYDTGGGKRWPSGTVGVNMSGEDEFVWRGSQLSGRGRPPLSLVVNVDARGAGDPQAVKAAVQAGSAELVRELDRLLSTGVGT